MEAGDGTEDRAVRSEGVRVIDYLKEEYPDQAMIVAGDFNLHGHYDPDVANLNLLKTELNIEDACEVLECGDDRIDRVFFRSGQTSNSRHWPGKFLQTLSILMVAPFRTMNLSM